MKIKIRTFAFDFDGVISQYDGIFKGDGKVDKPRPEVIKAIKLLRKQGHKVMIYSARSNKVLKNYCKKYKIEIDYFNHNPEYKSGNSGKPIAFAYVDDRAVPYKGQSAKKLVEQLNKFKPFWKKNR